MTALHIISLILVLNLIGGRCEAAKVCIPMPLPAAIQTPERTREPRVELNHQPRLPAEIASLQRDTEMWLAAAKSAVLVELIISPLPTECQETGGEDYYLPCAEALWKNLPKTFCGRSKSVLTLRNLKDQTLKQDRKMDFHYDLDQTNHRTSERPTYSSVAQIPLVLKIARDRYFHDSNGINDKS